jgi:hypothetical protein
MTAVPFLIVDNIGMRKLPQTAAEGLRGIHVQPFIHVAIRVNVRSIGSHRRRAFHCL